MASREETDTVIAWTLADEHATVCSMLPKIWRMCERAGGIEIRLEEGIRDGKKEVRTFLVDPSCVRIKPKRKVSAATRERLAAQGAALQAAKRAKSGTPA